MYTKEQNNKRITRLVRIELDNHAWLKGYAIRHHKTMAQAADFAIKKLRELDGQTAKTNELYVSTQDCIQNYKVSHSQKESCEKLYTQQATPLYQK